MPPAATAGNCGADMTLGLRLVFCLGVPAGVGIDSAGRADRPAAVPARAVSAGRHGSGGADDRLLRHRRVGVLRVAGGGARFYALNDYRTPVRRGRLDGRPESGPESDAHLADGRGRPGRVDLRGRRRASVAADGHLFAPSCAAGLAAVGRHGRAHRCLATLVMGVVVCDRAAPDAGQRLE